MKEARGVSVVIPVRDAERYVGEAMRSVLGQVYRPLELIVVDDGSADGTARAVRSFGADVRLVSQPALGIGVALNRGVSLARGGLLAFLDADDLWTPAKLERQVGVLREQPDIEAVFGHVEQFIDGAPSSSQPLPGYVRGTMLIRREALARIGPFATGLQVGEFLDWWARALDGGLRKILLEDIVLRRRIHADNLGVRLRSHQVDYARVLKGVLDRRRAAI